MRRASHAGEDERLVGALEDVQNHMGQDVADAHALGQVVPYEGVSARSAVIGQQSDEQPDAGLVGHPPLLAAPTLAEVDGEDAAERSLQSRDTFEEDSPVRSDLIVADRAERFVIVVLPGHRLRCQVRPPEPSVARHRKV